MSIKFSELVALLFSNIAKKNNEKLADNIKFLSVSKLQVNKSNELLDKFLQVAMKVGNTGAVSVLIDAWENSVPMESNTLPNYLTSLFGNRLFSDQLLKFIVYSTKSMGYVDVVLDLFRAGRSLWVPYALGRAERIYGPQTHEVYKELFKWIEEQGEEYVESSLYIFLGERYAETSPFVEIPKWIHNVIEPIPTMKELDILSEEITKEVDKKAKELIEKSIESPDELIDSAIKGLEQYVSSKEDLVKARKLLEHKIKVERDTTELHGIVTKQTQLELLKNQKLFMWYGPANPLYGQNLDTGSINDKYGGCRMFVCNYFDYDEEDELYIDWFTGICEQCLLRIKKPCYAVRMPKEQGAWVGCYCSWTCVRKQIRDHELMKKSLVDIFEEQMNGIGIQDRNY